VTGEGYKPISIRELLIEMKNHSELMIDLAYSAILFNDRELAKEVLELEKEVDRLRDLLNMEVMLAVRDAEDARGGIGIANVAIATDKISDAAADIAYLVLRGIRLHKIVEEAFKVVEERVEKIELKEKSPLVKKRVEDIHSEFGIDIIAIRRAGRWIINPADDVTLLPDSVLIVRGAEAGVEKIREVAEER
jgi:uncharacterized protein with PhoU and TrkA domain